MQRQPAQGASDYETTLSYLLPTHRLLKATALLPAVIGTYTSSIPISCPSVAAGIYYQPAWRPRRRVLFRIWDVWILVFASRSGLGRGLQWGMAPALA